MIRKYTDKLKTYVFGKPQTTEYRSGILVERRRLLWLPVAAAAAALLPNHSAANERADSLNDDGVGWQDFVRQTTPTAQALHKDPSLKGQDAYLFWIYP